MWKKLKEHVRQYWVIYLSLAGFYVAGIVLGAVGVGALSNPEAVQLSKFLDQLLTSQPTGLESSFLQILARDTLIMMAGIWLLGLTVIGAPLIYLIVLTRGFILGFTISFIIGVKGALGIVLVLVSVLIPGIASIPLLFLGAGLATIFSFLLMRGKAKGESLRKEFFYYTLAAALVSLGSAVTGAAQGYFSLLGIRLLGL
ncbi:MAG: stage II sporulation protein M [Desulfitobacteriaceae bacterium]|nr:stage II sporulation protein M [Desulfitobacteriaceae bacterium]MDI6880550.1 stage II sporulation protein M [Desulfitobacteriaceae bacterium]MDI6915887.1 stage II sporulation protein M [Desulfitobacteriaceae bacterium]